MRHLGLIVVTLQVLSACGDSGITTVDTPADDIQAVDTAVVDPPTDTSEPLQPDVQDVASSSCTEGEGCFGEPCGESADCLSEICTLHMGSKVCSKTCETSCPVGWSCTLVAGSGDGQYVCTSNFSHLCLPCQTADGCGAETLPSACVNYDGGLGFCGGSCDLDNPCPEGFSCQEVDVASGGKSFQCVANSGICPCSSYAAAASLGTGCKNTNEFGTCEGMRVCSDEGLGACDAAIPAAEICNGVDDDCNGTIDDATCDDGNACTEDTCNGEDGCTHTPLDSGECLDGDACTQADHCENGVCVGALLNCDDANPCTDDSCDPENGCQATLNFIDCDDGDACTLGDSCKDGTCAPGPAIACDDGNPCTDDSCGESGCVFAANSIDCDDANACTATSSCAEGACKAGEATDCGDDNPCTDEGCNPATGCVITHNTQPCDDGNTCTLGDSCVEGACTKGAKTLSCADGNLCTDDSCDPDTGCVFGANNATCDDGNDCTTDDVCSQGACAGQGSLACDDGNPCTKDSCAVDGGCENTPTEGACSDGDACTVNDACTDGTCTSGKVLDCDDGNVCTDASCSGGNCVFAWNDVDCDDGNACTDSSLCKEGLCTGIAPKVCNDDNPCTDDGCDPASGCTAIANIAPCSDSNACTLGDTCSGGSCKGGETALTCEDGNPCTDDTCDTQTGCTHVNNSLPCNDGNACTQDSVCKDGVCTAGLALTCDDGNSCTDDSCDIGQGCVHTPNAAICDDANACTVGDTCSEGSCSAGASSLNCEDDNPCTQNTCDAAKGCVFEPNSLACDDQNQCTPNDVCDSGACVGKGALTCDDNNECTIDICLPESGCSYEASDGNCSDGNACTTNDSCAEGECVGGEPPNCNDGNKCTDNTCEEAVGCVTTNNQDSCNDFNNASGLCAGGNCTFKDCDDGYANCDQTEANGCETAILSDPSNCGACGNACDIGETCQNGSCMGDTVSCGGYNYPKVTIVPTTCTGWFNSCSGNRTFRVVGCYTGSPSHTACPNGYTVASLMLIGQWAAAANITRFGEGNSVCMYTGGSAATSQCGGTHTQSYCWPKTSGCKPGCPTNCCPDSGPCSKGGYQAPLLCVK